MIIDIGLIDTALLDQQRELLTKMASDMTGPRASAQEFERGQLLAGVLELLDHINDQIESEATPRGFCALCGTGINV